MKTQQNRSIRIENLTEVVMRGRGLRQAKERLVPLEAKRYIRNPNDGPCPPHDYLLGANVRV
jgi:hypothetical protein